VRWLYRLRVKLSTIFKTAKRCSALICGLVATAFAVKRSFPLTSHIASGKSCFNCAHASGLYGINQPYSFVHLAPFIFFMKVGNSGIYCLGSTRIYETASNSSGSIKNVASMT